METPDRWVVLVMESKEFGSIEKVFCSWYGGYLGSDEWKMSSGITEVKEFDNRYEFLNVSGSIYKCYKNSYGMSGYMSQMLSYFIKTHKDTATFTIKPGYDSP